MNPLTDEELIAEIEKFLGHIPNVKELITRFRNLTSGKEEQIKIKVEHFDHDRTVMTNLSTGDTHTSYSEELGDFLHSVKTFKIGKEEQVEKIVEAIANVSRKNLVHSDSKLEFSIIEEDLRTAIKNEINGKIDKR